MDASMSAPERVNAVSEHATDTERARPGQSASPARSAHATHAAEGGDESQSLVRNLFASHPLPMLAYDVERLCILDVNDAMSATYGYTRDELLGMPIVRLLPPDEAPILLDQIRRVVRPGRAPYRPPCLWRHVYKNGQIRDVEVTAHDYTIDRREAVLVTINDVTDRLRAERERDVLVAQLRQEAAQKAAIIEQMIDAIIVADANGRVVLANRASHELFDVHGEEWSLLGNGMPPVMPLPGTLFDTHGNELPPRERPFARAMRGETVREEVRIVTASGRESWVSVTAGPLHGDHGQMTGVIWVGRETTDERARREQETQGEKLRALGQLASGIAHDLNQYLGMVAGYGDLTSRALDGPTPDLGAARDALEVVVRSAMEGSESVKRLLAFAQPPQDGEAEAVDLGGLLREVAAFTAPRWRDAARQGGAPISLTLDVVGDTTVKGWPSTLRDAFTNLIFNAIDALPQGGSIHLTAQQQHDRVVASVADTGAGIPREALPHVFEPFFTTKGERGTGLGLAIVYGIVERHQGAISVASPPGGGTTVTLSLPGLVATSTPAAPATRAEPTTTTTTLRILAVDDEPTITRMVQMMLGPYGHAITLASSGEEALVHLATAPFDLVLSDLGLGDGMNGWDLLDVVRERFPGTRFILSTGWGAQIDPLDVVARGGEGLLPKPYRLADLLRAIDGPA
jgi:PAS domain S-box-containing protein